MTDQLDDLISEVNSRWDEEKDRYVDAVMLRIGRLGANYGQKIKDQGGGIRAGDNKTNFTILAGGEEEP
ncbi:MAG: hypothetical protein ACYSR6_14850 [Planctomycetota bacterium]|jgi:hypothetical protein